MEVRQIHYRWVQVWIGGGGTSGGGGAGGYVLTIYNDWIRCLFKFQLVQGGGSRTINFRGHPGTDTVSSFPAGPVMAGYGGSGGGDSPNYSTRCIWWWHLDQVVEHLGGSTGGSSGPQMMIQWW